MGATKKGKEQDRKARGLTWKCNHEHTFPLKKTTKKAKPKQTKTVTLGGKFQFIE